VTGQLGNGGGRWPLPGRLQVDLFFTCPCLSPNQPVRVEAWGSDSLFFWVQWSFDFTCRIPQNQQQLSPIEGIYFISCTSFWCVPDVLRICEIRMCCWSCK
jgi:hypothetical protein